MLVTSRFVEWFKILSKHLLRDAMFRHVRRGGASQISAAKIRQDGKCSRRGLALRGTADPLQHVPRSTGGSASVRRASTDARTVEMMSYAISFSGTLCALPFFAISLGIVQTSAERSTSGQRIARTSAPR